MNKPPLLTHLASITSSIISKQSKFHIFEGVTAYQACRSHILVHKRLCPTSVKLVKQRILQCNKGTGFAGSETWKLAHTS